MTGAPQKAPQLTSGPAGGLCPVSGAPLGRRQVRRPPSVRPWRHSTAAANRAPTGAAPGARHRSASRPPTGRRGSVCHRRVVAHLTPRGPGGPPCAPPGPTPTA